MAAADAFVTDAGPRWTELVDTGGYGFEDEQGLTEHIKEQVEQAMARADLVLFIVDATAGIMPGDEMIAELLRKLGTKVVLLANKADSEKVDPSLGDFARLGFGTPQPISAVTGRNTRIVQETIAGNVDLSEAPHTPPEPDLKIAIVGKRNAGKSTLVNAIAAAFDPQKSGDRVIVSEVPGTTRDSVDVVIEKDDRTMTVIDTAGVRKKRHMVTDDIEFYSYHRAQRSIRRADVVLLLIDATLKVSEPDKKLGQYIVEQEKPVILVLNKWDLVKADLAEQNKKTGQDGGKKEIRDDELMEQYRDYLDEELRGLSFAPVAVITAKDGSKVPALLDLCRHLHRLAGVRVGTGQLNRALEAAMAERTPGGVGGKRRPKIYYATQVDTNPPHLVLFVNDPKLFDESYRRFLLNRFRDM
ncbi:MAG: GTP-binding protein, partial [Planctomycetota bacterium]